MTEIVIRRNAGALGALTAPTREQRAQSLQVRLIAAWDQYWFGQIAAVRPYLLMKAVWCMVAFDVWMLRVPVGGRYGAGEFGVAHFWWLDALQPLPGPGLYVGLMLAVGMLALVCALTDASRWTRALVALMYMYGWAMSLHDGYQHHYFLSLALATFIFFPRLRARDLFGAGAKPPVKSRRRAQISTLGTRTISAWGYALLGANVGIVYAYTALTKLDTEWRAGQVMGRLGRRSFGPIAERLVDADVPAQLVWMIPGLGIFALEGLIAAAYLLAVRGDETRRRSLRTITRLALVAAVGFHISAETVLSLRIGWFSYYMIALACVFFLPSSVLYALGALVHKRLARLASVGWSVAGRAGLSHPRQTTLVTVGTAGVMAAIGRSLDLPGAQIVGLLTAAALVVACAVTMILRRQSEILRYVLATGVAGALMWVAVGQSAVRPLYYTYLGRDLQKRGDLAGAADAFERARRYTPDDKAIERYVRRLQRQIDRAEE